jgi:transcriptional regulator with XRE-family HTH domain
VYARVLSDNYKKSRGRWEGVLLLPFWSCVFGPVDPRLAKVFGGTFAMGRVYQPRRSAPNRRRGPGERLRALRLVLGLSLRAVHGASIMISRRLRNSEFLLPASRLHEFETRNVVPSIHRLYTLACIYEYEIIDLLGWYGIPRRRVSPARIDTTGRP